MDPLALLAPLGDAAMFFDDHGNHAEFDLLQTLGRSVEIFQSTVATRTVVETVFPGIVQFLLGKGRSLVARVPWLPAPFSLAASCFRLLFLGLYDIRGGRLRGCRGVLLSFGQLAFEIGHARFEFLRATVQPFAVRAFVFLLGIRHDGKTLINLRKTTKISSKPVNAYGITNIVERHRPCR